MSRLVICAFESPAAAAQRRHYSPREIFQLPASTRRTPAHEAPSVGDGEAPASLPQQCMCGQTHEGTYSPTWNTGENIRLVETLIDSSVPFERPRSSRPIRPSLRSPRHPLAPRRSTRVPSPSTPTPTPPVASTPHRHRRPNPNRRRRSSRSSHHCLSSLKLPTCPSLLSTRSRPSR